MTNLGSNESRDNYSPSSKSLRPPWRADERVEGRKTFCRQDVELYLNADERQAGQRHKDVERKREYYHIIIFPERA